MFSITVKLMKKSARMLIPAGIAILIGTAFIAATFLFGNAMNDSLARQTTAQLGGANYVISVDSSEGLNEQERNDIYTRTVNDFQLDRIRPMATSMPAAMPSPPPHSVICCRSASFKATSRSIATK